MESSTSNVLSENLSISSDNMSLEESFEISFNDISNQVLAEFAARRC